MYVNGPYFDPLRPSTAKPATSPATARPTDAEGDSSSGTGQVRSDSVEFSDAGRSMAGRLEREQDAAFDPARVAELRTKVLSGAYNTLDVVDQVARRVIASGDI